MDNDLIFPPLDTNALMVAVLSPVLNQWVADTVAFHQSRLKLAGLVEPGRPRLSLDDCRRQAEDFRDLVLRSVQGGQWHVTVTFDGRSRRPENALSTFPIESLERLGELQKLGLLAGLRLVWPKELAHLDGWGMGMDSPAQRDAGPIRWPNLDPLSDESTDDDSDDSGEGSGQRPSPFGTPRRRGRPGDKCAIS